MRSREEKKIQNELAKLLNLQNIEKNKQEELKNSIQLQENNFRKDAVADKYDVYSRMNLGNYVSTSLKVIDTIQIKIEEMEPAIREVRGRLLIASRDKKIVEKLKERKLEEYNYKINQEISKENDDINQKIYFRRLAGNDN
jgi:flagellar protein FliJ